MTTREDLAKIKSRALRTGVWFRILSRLERAILDLTMKCVEKIQSKLLARMISTIINKMLQAYELEFLARAENVGRQMAEQLSIIAARWGNRSCSTWKHDLSYIRLLGINTICSRV